jgi:methyl-accepting chemotaxis protein
VLSLIFLFRMVRRMVTQPLDQAVETCAAIAEGDLSRSMETDRQDEIGRLLTALRTMSERLRNVVGQVTEGSQAIVLGADQIAAGNENLSQRTEEQASSLEETAASMEEMTGSVKQNAENAQAASRVADEARKASQQGSEVVQKAIVAMGEINTASEKIRDIIATIDGIAFQTNLLALNAAVEAARAGEQGRGFAVVASEVRALAQRAASSAKEIKVLIEDSVAKVGAGTALVDQSGVTLSEITANIRKAADIMSEISASSAEQASGVDQVSTAVSQMDDMTQQNAALVEEASAASRAMREQAQALYETMGFFKTGAARMASATSDRAALVAPSSPARSMTAGAERRSPARPLMGKPVSKRAATPDSHKDEHLQKLRSGQAQAARKAAGDEGEWEKF